MPLPSIACYQAENQSHSRAWPRQGKRMTWATIGGFGTWVWDGEAREDGAAWPTKAFACDITSLLMLLKVT